MTDMLGDMGPTQPDIDGPRAAVAEPMVDDEDLAVRPRQRHTIRVVALAVLLAAVLLSISLAKGLDKGRSVRSPLIGKPAPRFTLPRLDDTSSLDSATLRGNVTVVNFWASWCVPCRQEAANLESFAMRWASAGVKVVGVLYNDNVGDALKFRDEFGLTYPQVNDPDLAASIDYGVTGVPETFIIDESGVVVAKIIGAVGPTTLDDIISKLGAGSTVEIHNGVTQSGPRSTAKP